MADLTRVDRRDGPSRRVKDIGDGLYADVVGAVGDENVFDLTLTLDTSAYASGDVLSATAEITGFFVSTTSSRIITSVRVLDEDDQAGAGRDLAGGQADVLEVAPAGGEGVGAGRRDR